MNGGEELEPTDANLPRAKDYRENIQLQDLIMLTDIYALPQLLTMLSRAQLDENEIEYRILD